jgi:hypothetical protein
MTGMNLRRHKEEKWASSLFAINRNH